MAYGEFRALTAEEAQICRENGIDPKGKSVIVSGEDFLRLLHHKTRDSISIRYGEGRMRTKKERKHK